MEYGCDAGYIVTKDLRVFNHSSPLLYSHSLSPSLSPYTVLYSKFLFYIPYPTLPYPSQSFLPFVHTTYTLTLSLHPSHPTPYTTLNSYSTYPTQHYLTLFRVFYHSSTFLYSHSLSPSLSPYPLYSTLKFLLYIP